MQLAFVALFALVLAPTLCDAQAVRRASPEEPSGRKRGRPGGPSHQVQRPSKYEHNNEPGHKPNNGGVCAPEKTCYTDHECAAEFPCTKTECVLEPHHLFKLGYKNAVPSGMGVCVCFENKPVETPCIGDKTECKGPLGKCDNAGVCNPQPNEDGCPCADTDCDFPVDDYWCVDPDFKCICKSGACVVNYLPPGGPCIPSTYTEVGVCQEAICVKPETLGDGTPDEVECKVQDRPDNTACFADFGEIVGSNPPEPTCANAGVCNAGVCDNLFCKVEPAEKCEAKFPGQDTGCTTQDCGSGNARCDQACHDATDGEAACLSDPLSCRCSSPGGGQNQFNCELSDGGVPPVGDGTPRCCVCDTPDPKPTA
jgi:hypothetical protein